LEIQSSAVTEQPSGWYKDAVVYELHVRTFADSNGDGVGDFPGLIQKLDYLQDLGVNAIWLLPFFPSPLHDDDYDVSDYCAGHPSYGTFQDFKSLVAEVHKRGLRIIVEIVLSHTSDQHPWFVESRRSRDNPKRDWHVWHETDAHFQQARITFLVVNNLSSAAQAVELNLQKFIGLVPKEMAGRNLFPTISRIPYRMTLRPYQSSWFHLKHVPSLQQQRWCSSGAQPR
jgi:hypothetical protein